MSSEVPEASDRDAPLVAVEDLAVAFGDVPVVSGVDLRVDRGDLVGVVGPNGAGKTTVLRAINGTIAPDAETRQAIEIENLGETPLYDVTAAIRPTPPFTSGSPTGYVSQLDPGETTTIAVHLETSGDAVLGTRSLPVNVTAEDGDGNRIATGPQGVEIEVATPAGQTDDITLFAVGVVVVVLILAAGWWWLRQ